MRTVGSGFLGQNLAAIASRHPDAVVFAAGPSSGASTETSDFDREAVRLRETLAHCTTSGERLVYISTASAGLYGRAEPVSRESGPARPESPYGQHKLRMEDIVAKADPAHLTVRLAYPVGRRQPAHQLVPALVANIRSGKVKVLSGARRDLIDAADFVRTVDSLLDARVTGVVNVGSGHPVPVSELVAELEKRLGITATIELVASPADPRICTEKLRQLVPAVADFGFGADYFRQVLDRYVLR
ncbi:NAD-dependent epimerase/dehydratase family protein [Fodinicola feengrottensis]|uniref:NAD-dependent epimerase/dehydratase family protein n=1 Tax=Fodinicola feengrottensis TaxID=435914 RepID=A0ABP4UJS0_9ACTN|nr:NAD-dependent epimerase/dehydratase family protein [Fodinicola feengrottensis]